MSVQPYQFEPELTEEEIREQEESIEIREEEWKDRQGHNIWCSCSFCAPMATNQESKCSHEDHMLIEIRNEECITLEEGFLTTVFNEHVHLIIEHNIALNPNTQDVPLQEETEESPQENIIDPESLEAANKRYMAYRTYVRWICAGFKLGHRNRVVIPSCVIMAVRERWPDPKGNYRGHIAI